MMVTGSIKKLWQAKVIRGLPEEKGDFHDLTYFPTWMGGGGGGGILDHEIISIHEIKTGSYR